ncbi:hypothetical protein [Isoptericola aurantiacus]|uniref:hypothetical protein n=1 Tax=Isoptericola aurantiacus TaxID=3377839 RepID=UPI00383B20EE
MRPPGTVVFDVSAPGAEQGSSASRIVPEPSPPVAAPAPTGQPVPVRTGREPRHLPTALVLALGTLLGSASAATAFALAGLLGPSAVDPAAEVGTRPEGFGGGGGSWGVVAPGEPASSVVVARFSGRVVTVEVLPADTRRTPGASLPRLAPGCPESIPPHGTPPFC